MVTSVSLYASLGIALASLGTGAQGALIRKSRHREFLYDAKRRGRERARCSDESMNRPRVGPAREARTISGRPSSRGCPEIH